MDTKRKGISDGADRQYNERIARIIAEYWRHEGYESPDVGAIPGVAGTGTKSDKKRGALWGVRSDMVNGMPRRRKPISDAE